MLKTLHPVIQWNFIHLERIHVHFSNSSSNIDCLSDDEQSVTTVSALLGDLLHLLHGGFCNQGVVDALKITASISQGVVVCSRGSLVECRAWGRAIQQRLVFSARRSSVRSFSSGFGCSGYSASEACKGLIIHRPNQGSLTKVP